MLIALNVVSSSVSIDVGGFGNVIINDDDEAILTIIDVQGTESDGSISVTVELQGDTDAPFSVNLATGDLLDAAVGGTDYVPNVETLFFSGFDGEQQTFTVEVNDELVVEGDESFAILADQIDAAGRNVHFEGVSGPFGITEVGRLNLSLSASVAVDTVEGIAYVADRVEGLRVVDVRDPANPVEIGFYGTSPLSWR